MNGQTECCSVFGVQKVGMRKEMFAVKDCNWICVKVELENERSDGMPRIKAMAFENMVKY